MASFAIICEGISENLCIRAIIERFRKSDCFFSSIEPEIGQNHGRPVQSGFGGWVEVLRHCTTEVFKKALSVNDYLIVQIDTDQCGQSPFSINQYDGNGKPRSPKELYNDIVLRLLKDVDISFYEANKSRIIFAVCFNEIECWFLPLFFDDARACATTGCISKINIELQKEGKYYIPEKEKNNDIARRTYQYLFSQKKFKKDIQGMAACNFGFNAMIEQLKLIPDTQI